MVNLTDLWSVCKILVIFNSWTLSYHMSSLRIITWMFLFRIRLKKKKWTERYRTRHLRNERRLLYPLGYDVWCKMMLNQDLKRWYLFRHRAIQSRQQNLALNSKIRSSNHVFYDTKLFRFFPSVLNTLYFLILWVASHRQKTARRFRVPLVRVTGAWRCL